MNKPYVTAKDIEGNICKINLVFNNALILFHKKYKEINIKNDKINTITLYDNNLETLTVNGNNIYRIELGPNKLKELDLSMCKNLKLLQCNIELENGLILPHNNVKIYFKL